MSRTANYIPLNQYHLSSKARRVGGTSIARRPTPNYHYARNHVAKANSQTANNGRQSSKYALAIINNSYHRQQLA